MPNEVITMADISRMELFTRKVFHQSFTGEHDAQVPFIRNNRCPFILKGPGILKGATRRIPLSTSGHRSHHLLGIGNPLSGPVRGEPCAGSF